MNVAFIPSKGRPEQALKCARSIVAFGNAKPVIVIEPSQEYAYADLNTLGYTIYLLPQDGRGIGYARNQIMQIAHHNEEDVILMADDDARATSPYQWLLEEARSTICVGIGAWASIYGLYIGNDVRHKASENGDIILSKNGMGCQFMALNVANVMKVGNFPEWADVSLEDHELIRQTIAHGHRWWIHPEVTYSCGTRHHPGGLATFGDREERAWECWRRSHETWPDFVNDPWHSNKYRCFWKKLIERYA